MNLDSARELKEKAKAMVLASISDQPIGSATVAFAASSLAVARAVQPRRMMAVGIAPATTKSGFKLALRLQRMALRQHPLVEKLVEQAKGEVDIRHIGRIDKRSKPWVQSRHRPLQIGCSIGHYEITAGTLGAFVKSNSVRDKSVYALSNNHVLANENEGRRGDKVLQPGTLDGGRPRHASVGTLTRFVRLKSTKPNLVDCAIAAIDPAHLQEDTMAVVKGVGRISGLSDVVDDGLRVSKLGRTTGLTHGRVSAFDLDNLVVSFDMGNVSFDNQIEIEGRGNNPFSDGGDSGALILNEEHAAVGLLFAGSDTGGSNNRGLTFANPLNAVLQALKVQLIF